MHFFRSVASVTMDLDDVERIDFTARRGAETIVVNDVGGTDLVEIDFDVADVPGTGVADGHPDSVIVTGTTGDDLVLVTGDASGVSVLGLAA